MSALCSRGMLTRRAATLGRQTHHLGPLSNFLLLGWPGVGGGGVEEGGWNTHSRTHSHTHSFNPLCCKNAQLTNNHAHTHTHTYTNTHCRGCNRLCGKNAQLTNNHPGELFHVTTECGPLPIECCSMQCRTTVSYLNLSNKHQGSAT